MAQALQMNHVGNLVWEPRKEYHKKGGVIDMRWIKALILMALVAAPLGGCVIAPYPPYWYHYSYDEPDAYYSAPRYSSGYPYRDRGYYRYRDYRYYGPRYDYPYGY